jgi:hypothetical protein
MTSGAPVHPLPSLIAWTAAGAAERHPGGARTTPPPPPPHSSVALSSGLPATRTRPTRWPAGWPRSSAAAAPTGRDGADSWNSRRTMERWWSPDFSGHERSRLLMTRAPRRPDRPTQPPPLDRGALAVRLRSTAGAREKEGRTRQSRPAVKKERKERGRE